MLLDLRTKSLAHYFWNTLHNSHESKQGVFLRILKKKLKLKLKLKFKISTTHSSISKRELVIYD